MSVAKRFVAGLILVPAAAGLILSLTGAVGVWVVKEPVTTRATRILSRVEAALDVAEHGLDQVKVSLDRAEERLADLRQGQSDPARTPSAARRMMARTVARQVSPELGNAQEELHAVAEAAVVVNSVLEDLANLPFLDTSRLDLDRLAQIKSRLAEVGPAASELGRLLGDPDPDPGPAAGAQLSRVKEVVVTVRQLTAEYELLVGQIRQQTHEIRAQMLPWILPAAVVVSFGCVWIALSQVCLLVCAWSWWKRSGRAGQPPQDR
jgi:hypothetical protein